MDEKNEHNPIKVKNRKYNAGRPPMFPHGKTVVQVSFDKRRFEEVDEWCKENLVQFQAFVRRAVDELIKRLKGKA